MVTLGWYTRARPGIVAAPQKAKGLEQPIGHRAVFRFRVKRPFNGEEGRFSPEATFVSRAQTPPNPNQEGARDWAPGQQVAPHLRVVPAPQDEPAVAATARWLLPIVEQLLMDGVQLGRELQNKHGRRIKPEKPPQAE